MIKINIRIIIAIISVIALPGYLQAQDVNIEDYNNVASTVQTGDGNLIDIAQSYSMNSNHYAKVTQNGGNNSIILRQEGFENSILSDQSGIGNSIISEVTGNGNDYKYTQNGNGNDIVHRSNRNNDVGGVNQSGNNNSITLDETGGNYMNGIIITQTGEQHQEIIVTTGLRFKK